MIKARVRGSRPEPYKVTIEVRKLTESDWRKVAKELSQQALFLAKLLAGVMPQEIEQAFERVSLSLFPKTRGDLVTECSCPDWSNPCKHIAAVYYLLGEEFDRDPFLIFKMRGKSREELVELLAEKPANATGRPHSLVSPQVQAQSEPLPANPSTFWTAVKLPEDFWGNVETPAVTAPLLKRLGKFPFWRGKTPLQEALGANYSRASEIGLKLWLGEREASGV